VLSSYYDVLQDLYPEPGYGLAVARDPAFHLAQRRVSIEVLEVIARFMAANRDLTYRMARGWRRSRPGLADRRAILIRPFRSMAAGLRSVHRSYDMGRRSGRCSR